MFSADVTTKQRIIAICLVRENSDALGHFSLLILSENFYLLGENKMNSFRIQNIKAFKDSGEIELKPITILVGKNSSGKSSLLRFPGVLAQTANYNGNNPPLSFFGEYIDYGNFEDVVHGKNGNEISFSLSYNVDLAGNVQVSTQFGKTIVRVNKLKTVDIHPAIIKVTLRRDKKVMKVKQVLVLVDNSEISNLSWNEEDEKYNFILSKYKEDGSLEKRNVINFDKNDIIFDKFFPICECRPIDSIINNLGYSIDENRKFELDRSSFLTSHGFENIELSDLSKDEQVIVDALKLYYDSTKVMSEIYDLFIAESRKMISYIGPFRQNPNRIYRYSEAIQMHVGAKGEKIGDILVRAYQKNDKDSLFNDISDWIKKNYGYKLEINEMGGNYFQVMLLDDNELKSNIIDVGFGISQVLPIISELFMLSAKKSKSKYDLGIRNIVLVEQPELHLHPAAQANLAELFAKCVTINKDARLIIETHSEHLISKLQVLIADEECPITNDMVQILYVDKNENGEATIQEMKIKENGKFVNKWPTGFFDQGYNLSYELMKKSSSRGKRSEQ